MLVAATRTEVDPLLDWGVPLLRWFNDLPAWLDPVFDAASFLGSVEALTVVAATLLWSVNASLGWRVVLVLLVYGALNTPMKVGFGLPRPYWVLPDLTARAAESSYGMPSGHSGFAMAVYGRIALAVGRPAGWVGGGALIATIAASRMYLGVHWPTDVLGGLLAGAVVLLAVRRTEPALARLGREHRLLRTIAWSVAVTVLLLAVVVGVALLASDRSVPAAWSELAATAQPDGEPLDPHALDGPIGSTGALLGFAVGWLVLRRQGGYDAGGPLGRRVGRLPLGLAGAALLFGGVGVEPAGDASVLDLAATWFQYAAAGAWMGWGAPTLFVVLGLASRSGPHGRSAERHGSAG